MHVGILREGEHTERLFDLLESLAMDSERIPNREMMPYVIPWAIPSYRMWGLFDRDRLVGILDGLPVGLMYHPYYIGVSQWFYVEKPYREHSWKLVREALRYARSMGVAKVSIVSNKKNIPFWSRHSFSVCAVQMERMVGG